VPREVELATYLRAIHSRRQLLEVMTDFWHNHFNIFAWDWPQQSLWSYTDREVIRAHALGNFLQLLEAEATSPPMLFYLDNFLGSAEDANENYARELLELHTCSGSSLMKATARASALSRRIASSGRVVTSSWWATTRIG
jgi:uncharacterized protein (DUF1800 family)